MLNLSDEILKVNSSDLPDFYDFTRPLEMGLWILWVAKDKLQRKQLTAKEIACIIRETKEISIDAKSLIRAFSRAKEKIHTYRRNGKTYYEIMKPGKDYLSSKISNEQVEVFYFEPGNRFSSKRILSKNLLNRIESDFGIVDPYCGVRTLDILKEIDERNIKFLTKLDNLRPNQKTRFLRHLTDFKTECNHVEFRDYPSNDIHDRYIISDDHLVILGHSIKDLGSKETFSIFLNEEIAKDIVQSLRDNFNRRWSASTPI